MQDSQLVKRLKSFAWRLSMVLAVAAVDFVAANIADLSLPSWAVVIVGLGAGELSKYLNTRR